MKKVRFGILGASHIAMNALVPAIFKSKNAVFEAVASSNKKRAVDFAKRFGIQKAYDGYKSMLADPDIDAVYISLPNHLHAPWALASLKAGKNVLLEKPITCSAEELKKLQQIASSKGLICMEAFMFYFNNRLRTAKALMNKGAVGDIKFIISDFSVPIHKPNIRFLDKPGAGAFADLGTYNIAITNFLSGEKPKGAYCKLDFMKGTKHVDITYAGLLTYPGGKFAVFNGGFLKEFSQGIYVTGTKGKIVIDRFLNSGASESIKIIRDGNVRHLKVEVPNHYILEVEDFCSAILKKRQPFITDRMTLEHRKLLDALLLSAAKNHPVQV